MIEAEHVQRWSDRLRPLHEAWVATHNEGMALSLPTAAVACRLAEALGCAVLDLGSGFSSAALRQLDVPVVTVDNDLSWLEDTGRFLDAHQIPRGVLLSMQMGAGDFGVVVHDLGDMTLRPRTLRYAMSQVGRRGYLVLDDMHFPKYREHVELQVGPPDFQLEDLREQTLDSFGRFSAIARRVA